VKKSEILSEHPHYWNQREKRKDAPVRLRQVTEMDQEKEEGITTSGRLKASILWL